MGRGIDWSQYPLGQVSDRKIALAAGVCRQAVCRARARLGIPGLTSNHALARVARRYIWGAASRQLRRVSEIHRAVLDDYGSIAIRSVHRHLTRLVRSGHLTRVRTSSDAKDWGYVRTKKMLRT